MIRLENGKFIGTNKRSFAFENFTVTETEYLNPVESYWHCHANHHLTLILEGGNREIRKNAEIQAAPGKVLTYPEQLSHKNIETSYPSRNINIEIHQSFLNKFNLDSSLTIREDSPFYILKIWKECIDHATGSAAAIVSLLINLFQPKRKEKTRANPTWLRMIREILNDHWSENISLEELSGHLNIHPVTISRYFPKHFHCTLGQYSRKIKIQKAIELIKVSDHSLTDIGLQCGFFDQSHFIKTFTAITGLTPREFRKL